MMSDSLEHTVNISDRVAIDDYLLNYTKLAGKVNHIFVSSLAFFFFKTHVYWFVMYLLVGCSTTYLSNHCKQKNSNIHTLCCE